MAKQNACICKRFVFNKRNNTINRLRLERALRNRKIARMKDNCQSNYPMDRMGKPFGAERAFFSVIFVCFCSS